MTLEDIRGDRIAELEAAIRKHRDYRGDNRCWLDDEELYSVLPEGYTPPEREVAVEKENCDRFICNRRNPATVYVSPQEEIDRLTAEVVRLEEKVKDLQANAERLMEEDY